MKYLIITAHLGHKGHTKDIAKSFAGAVKKEGASVEIMNLYDKKWEQSFLDFEEQTDDWRDETTKKIQQHINDADVLIFVFPIWWNDAPAIMKNFIDVNLTAGFAYHFTKKGPVGNLNKRAYVFATADGPSWLYSLWLSPFRITWSKMRLGFCGLNVKKFIVFGMMQKKTESDSRKRSKQVTDIAQKDIKKYSE